MAVTLIGEVVNSADSVTGFATGGISGDDDFVEGTGALGVKASNTTVTLSTTSLGAGAPYDFSVGGTEEGYHLIGWFNTKTPIAATGGLRFFVGNDTTNYNHYYVDPTVFYKGGFITKVIDPARDSDIANGTYTTTGNPAQLTAVANIGMVFDTITSIMGSFNNVQIDQFTIGLGVRADGGSSFTPNTFETVRVADEDTNFWGWWSSTQGAFIGKGKLYIGPSAGSAVSVFEDDAFSVIFADELVSSDFYEINIRGAGTEVRWDLASVGCANVAQNRWNLTVDSTTLVFTDLNGIWSEGGVMSLNSNTTLTNTTMIDITQVVQNGATVTGVVVLGSNEIVGEAAWLSDNPTLISDCTFNRSSGHALELDTPGVYTLTNIQFEGMYGADGTTTAMIYNNSGGAITLNITGGGTVPTVRNGASASTTVVASNTITLTNLVANSEVRLYEGTLANASTATELDGVENSGTTQVLTHSAAGQAAYIVVVSLAYENETIIFSTLPSNDLSIPVQQRVDLTYENP